MSIGLLCNSCQCTVDGIAYRTRCYHFYCPTCAKNAFQNDSFCPICNSSLNENDVNEVTIGIPSVTLMDSLFQNALQSGSWDRINDNLQQISLGVMELTRFVTSQLLFEVSLSAMRRKAAEQERDHQASRLEKMNEIIIEQEMKGESLSTHFQQQISEKNRELSEIHEAYKEKLRKCQAWEKAYNNIRNQITVGQQASGREAVFEGVMPSTSYELPKQRTDVTTFRIAPEKPYQQMKLNYPQQQLHSNILPASSSLTTSFSRTFDVPEGMWHQQTQHRKGNTTLEQQHQQLQRQNNASTRYDDVSASLNPRAMLISQKQSNILSNGAVENINKNSNNSNRSNVDLNNAIVPSSNNSKLFTEGKRSFFDSF